MQERRLRRKDHSTVGKDEYIWDHIVFGGIFGFNLYKLLPVVAPIAYYHQSFMRLILCMVVTSVIGIALSYKSNRTNLGMMSDVLLGLGSYVVLTIGAYKSGLIKVLLIVSVALTVISLYSIFTNKIKRPDKIKQIIWNRIRRSFLLVRRNAGVACGVALIAVPMAVHFTSNEKIVTKYYDNSGISATESPFEDEYEVAQAYDDRYQLSENIDVIKKIRNNDEFQSLSYEEKCEVVTAVIYNQARYLGLCEINIEFKELRDSTLGQYDHSTKTITINSKQLKDGSLDGGSNEQVLMTACHEARHCYQHLLLECYVNLKPEERNLYAFQIEGVPSWIENMNHYNICDDECTPEEYFDYLNQPLEADANGWARSEVFDYFYYIDKYTGALNEE